MSELSAFPTKRDAGFRPAMFAAVRWWDTWQMFDDRVVQLASFWSVATSEMAARMYDVRNDSAFTLAQRKTKLSEYFGFCAQIFTLLSAKRNLWALEIPKLETWKQHLQWLDDRADNANNWKRGSWNVSGFRPAIAIPNPDRAQVVTHWDAVTLTLASWFNNQGASLTGFQSLEDLDFRIWLQAGEGSQSGIGPHLDWQRRMDACIGGMTHPPGQSFQVAIATSGGGWETRSGWDDRARYLPWVYSAGVFRMRQRTGEGLEQSDRIDLPQF